MARSCADERLHWLRAKSRAAHTGGVPPCCAAGRVNAQRSGEGLQLALAPSSTRLSPTRVHAMPAQVEYQSAIVRSLDDTDRADRSQSPQIARPESSRADAARHS